ncbi:MAG: hypothetical protein ACJ71Q_05090 [Terriglobales bacterium]|jgi:hypothetical protein
MSLDQMRPELWIGQVEIRPRDRKAYGAAGALVDILTWASNPSEYRAKAETIAATIDLYVVGVESEEPLSARLARITPSEELEDMISRAESNPNAIVWGTFHQWNFDTA